MRHVRTILRTYHRLVVPVNVAADGSPTGAVHMTRASRRRPHGPQPSVANPRQHLLAAVLEFVHATKACPGVLRIALVGSLTTDKPVPKDADVLVTIASGIDLAPLALRG